MREMINMVVVLTVISLASGGLLAALREGTQERIEIQTLEFVKGPAIRNVLQGASNDPIANRFQIKEGDALHNFFVGVFDGQPTAVAVEASAKGYKGDMGMMVALDVKQNKLLGVAVTTHAETAGLGAKAQSDPKFSGQFKGVPVTSQVKVTQDGGSINAISGATITSRAVCGGVANALATFEKLKPQILEKMNAVK